MFIIFSSVVSPSLSVFILCFIFISPSVISYLTFIHILTAYLSLLCHLPHFSFLHSPNPSSSLSSFSCLAPGAVRSLVTQTLSSASCQVTSICTMRMSSTALRCTAHVSHSSNEDNPHNLRIHVYTIDIQLFTMFAARCSQMKWFCLSKEIY